MSLKAARLFVCLVWMSISASCSFEEQKTIPARAPRPEPVRSQAASSESAQKLKPTVSIPITATARYDINEDLTTLSLHPTAGEMLTITSQSGTPFDVQWSFTQSERAVSDRVNDQGQFDSSGLPRNTSIDAEVSVGQFKRVFRYKIGNNTPELTAVGEFFRYQDMYRSRIQAKDPDGDPLSLWIDSSVAGVEASGMWVFATEKAMKRGGSVPVAIDDGIDRKFFLLRLAKSKQLQDKSKWETLFQKEQPPVPDLGDNQVPY
jgi:hypothetical protein